MIKASSKVNSGHDSEEEEDEEEVRLQERLIEVKTLMFETNRRTNEQVVRISQLEQVLNRLNTICADYNSYGEFVFSV